MRETSAAIDRYRSALGAVVFDDRISSQRLERAFLSMIEAATPHKSNVELDRFLIVLSRLGLWASGLSEEVAAGGANPADACLLLDQLAAAGDAASKLSMELG